MCGWISLKFHFSHLVPNWSFASKPSSSGRQGIRPHQEFLKKGEKKCFHFCGKTKFNKILITSTSHMSICGGLEGSLRSLRNKLSQKKSSVPSFFNWGILKRPLDCNPFGAQCFPPLPRKAWMSHWKSQLLLLQRVCICVYSQNVPRFPSSFVINGQSWTVFTSVTKESLWESSVLSHF